MLFFRFKSDKFIHDFTSSGMIRSQDHITNKPHNGALAQGISRPLFGVLLDVKMFCLREVQFFENFTLCELNNFDVILRNTFLDVYEVDIFHNKSKVRVHEKIGFKLKNLNVEIMHW